MNCLWGLALSLQALVSAVVDGRCFEVSEARYCLAGISVPAEIDLAPADKDLAAASHLALQERIEGQSVFLEPVGGPDRWGRQPVLAFLEGEAEPVQTALLERGRAALVPGLVPPAYDESFHAAQLSAQIARRGLWDRESTRVLYADEALRGEGQLRYVRGRVLYAYEGRDWTYLNFTNDYRTDFTIMLKPSLAKGMTEEGRPAESFAGRFIEVYGLIENINGPAIVLDDGASIRIIPD